MLGATQYLLSRLPEPVSAVLEAPLPPAHPFRETGGVSSIVFPPKAVGFLPALSLELGIWVGLLEVDESKKSFPARFLLEFESHTIIWSNPLILWQERLSLTEE